MHAPLWSRARCEGRPIWASTCRRTRRPQGALACGELPVGGSALLAAACLGGPPLWCAEPRQALRQRDGGLKAVHLLLNSGHGKQGRGSWLHRRSLSACGPGDRSHFASWGGGTQQACAKPRFGLGATLRARGRAPPARVATQQAGAHENKKGKGAHQSNRWALKVAGGESVGC
ncbi:MAG: hypothetical protein J3K34DRAFT_408920, partial [Monoraphidium minutum]